jgi:hypothetical protein
VVPMLLESTQVSPSEVRVNNRVVTPRSRPADLPSNLLPPLQEPTEWSTQEALSGKTRAWGARPVADDLVSLPELQTVFSPWALALALSTCSAKKVKPYVVLPHGLCASMTGRRTGWAPGEPQNQIQGEGMTVVSLRVTKQCCPQAVEDPWPGPGAAWHQPTVTPFLHTTSPSAPQGASHARVWPPNCTPRLGSHSLAHGLASG